jgi:peptide deformylase
MPILDIITPINPVLRQPANKVRALTPKVQRLIDDMIETMRAAPGVGLAAPQVAVSQRIIVVEFGEPSEDPEAPPAPPELYALINPEIVRRSQERLSGVEACLSIPGFAGEVERDAAVTVKGINRHGDEVKIKAQGWLARILQHEIDHLAGVLFIDRAEGVWRVEPEGEEAVSRGI